MDLFTKRMIEHAAYGTPVSEQDIYQRMQRCGGECICAYCGKEYHMHPIDGEVLFIFPELFLHHICDGTLAKL